MTKLAGFIGATVGGALGWWIGARWGVMTAFFLSVLGTGAGIYYGRKVVEAYF